MENRRVEELSIYKNSNLVALIYSAFGFLITVLVVISLIFQRDLISTEIVEALLGFAGFQGAMISVYLFAENSKKVGSIGLGLLLLINLIWIHRLFMMMPWSTPILAISELVMIICGGILFGSRGSLITGLIAMISMNSSVVVHVADQDLPFLLPLIIDNSALILSSLISGRLSEHFDTLGLKLVDVSSHLERVINLHELVLKSIPSGVVTFDGSQEIVQSNESAVQHVGAGPHDAERWRSFFAAVKEAPLNRFQERECEWKVGESTKIFRIQTSQIESEEKQSVGEVIVFDDVTQIREMERHLQQQEKLAAVGKLAAGIAHEIRNPLASISGSVQLLSNQADNDEDRRLFKIVIKETDRLNLLISEFLDYAKPFPKPTETLDLGSIVNEVMELLSLNPKLRKDIELDLRVPLGLRVLGFKDKLKQAILNIVINAYQAMEKTTNPRLMIELIQADNLNVLKIRDNGMGMAEETQKRLFEPFFTTKSQGTGLGLAVTHKIFESHGASIIVESQSGLGTEFVIKFEAFGKVKSA